jgi:hypothetical protein
MVNPLTLSLLRKGRYNGHPFQHINNMIGDRFIHYSIGRSYCDGEIRRKFQRKEFPLLHLQSSTSMIPTTISNRFLSLNRYPSYTSIPVLSKLRHMSSMMPTQNNSLFFQNQRSLLWRTNTCFFRNNVHQSFTSYCSRSNMSLTTSAILPDPTNQQKSVSTIDLPLQRREFSVKAGRKTIAVERKRQIARAKKQGNYPTGSGHWIKKKKPEVSGEGGEEPASLQHLEWVQFQRNIAVDGFETGQTTDVVDSRKVRGGAIARKKREKKLAIVEDRLAERRRLTESGGGHFPPVRYSEEETEQLLNMAYAAIPIRGGKRGTRNLKRQKRRWALVRRIRRTYKEHMAYFQERKMYKRAEKMQQIKNIINKAPEARMSDHQYQTEVFKKWWSLTHL